jgi:hypothetical protein
LSRYGPNKIIGPAWRIDSDDGICVEMDGGFKLLKISRRRQQFDGVVVYPLIV